MLYMTKMRGETVRCERPAFLSLSLFIIYIPANWNLGIFTFTLRYVTFDLHSESLLVAGSSILSGILLPDLKPADQTDQAG